MDNELPENQLRADIRNAANMQQPPPIAPGQLAPGVDPSKPSASWLKEITAAENELKKFWETGERVNNRFLDRRDTQGESDNKLNLFTTNTNILIATLYAKFPEPVVNRRWEDPDDDVARTASLILERNLEVEDRDSFDVAMKHVVQDRLVPGMGQVWFRYEPTIQTVPNPDYNPQMAEQQPQIPPQLDRLINEEVATDYVHWQDFIWSPCRVWAECRWVARKVKMTKADVETRFGPFIAQALQYKKGVLGDAQDPSGANENQEVFYATVYELWCKRTRHIYWVSKGIDFCLDCKPDPFNLPKFWPCPKPLFALTGTSSTVPRADYLMIQDQYEELDKVNHRIVMLERAVKVVGVYDKTNPEIGRIFEENLDNAMLAGANFAAFAEKGGFKGMMDWVPIEAIVNALTRLREVRADLIQQIYELSGISDIMRGATKASETLGAQRLKAQYGSVRLNFLQMEISSFVEEALDVKARIMIKMFQPQTLVTRSNIESTPDAQYIPQAMQLFQQPVFQFRVRVHADSMAVPEFNAERDARMDYLRAISEFLTGMAPIVQQQPGSAPYLLKMMQWGAAGFRVGRSIEGVLDQAIAAAEKALAVPKSPSPDQIATVKKDESQAMLNTAKAVGQSIENEFARKQPDEVFGHAQETPRPPVQ